MRTNIEIDDQLVDQAMRTSGTRTKKAVVELVCDSLSRHIRRRQFVGFAARFSGKEP
jgi:Arc/MetJ family transcription regulator